MAATNYVDSRCKTAINRVYGMPFKWSLNPYRGCMHACHYCYARESHTFLGLNADSDFERQIFVKSNIAEALDRELSRPGWAGESIAIGTATDAYQAAEKRFRLTRACLEVLQKHNQPFSVVTKSPLIARDLDLIREISRRARVHIYFTVTTVDEALSDKIEPGAFPPRKRLEALEMLAAEGIVCGVMMAPVMPGLNDRQDQIEAVAEAAAAAGASTFWAGPLRLAPPVRNHFFAFLQREFPTLLPWYMRRMEGQHLPESVQQRIEDRAANARARFSLAVTERRARPEPAFVRPLPAQLAIPLPELDPPTPIPLRYDPLSA
ncbi:MAG: radical SAM protein [Thermomicrobiales bacterium]